MLSHLQLSHPRVVMVKANLLHIYTVCGSVHSNELKCSRTRKALSVLGLELVHSRPQQIMLALYGALYGVSRGIGHYEH